ncbi:hypothetical protein F4779DRAFT_394815 [Xylariaceae sp. FL0662B]|nr:hypothetical protein F4779DRAFT_394815 [Xylariaceae sp. FL0662B]
MSEQSSQRRNGTNRVPDFTAMQSTSAASAQQRQRHDGQSSPFRSDGQPLTDPESWVEVSSQPSSSSVSSIGDEIVTTGLQVGASYDPRRRRRRLHPDSYAHLQSRQPTSGARQATHAGAGSSQEEYEESESEEDHVLTSSTENIASPQTTRNTPLRQVVQANTADSDSSDEDDDENATALGRRPPEPFRPQPNAFSHPPSHLSRHSTGSAIPQHPGRPSFTQRSQTRIDHRSRNFMPSNHQADNDAALRASLTTLLSCAAAARSRPKDGEKDVRERESPAGGSQPVELRIVPESELMAPPPPSPQVPRPGRSSRERSSAAPSREASGEKIKRAATPTSGTRPPRATKKKKTTTGEEALISPTLLTWVVSAGVVVLVSVVGFGAGYVIGREVGRQETLNSLGAAGNASAVAEGTSCGREAIRSSGGTLRRFRWGAGMGTSAIA